MATYKRETLEAKTSKDLKAMCVHELNIPGVTKKDKGTVIDAIMAKYGRKTKAKVAKKAVVKKGTGPLTGLSFSANSQLTNKSAPFGSRTTTTVHVSCGASSGNFPVSGKTVQEVGDFLREILNVDKLSTGLVNGQAVAADYIIKTGDNLEFLKPAGKKGC